MKKVIDFLQNEMGVKKIRFPETSSIGVKPVSVEGSERLIRAAIEYALKNNRRSVTLVHKGNIMKFTEGGFKNWGYDLVRREYADVAAVAADCDWNPPAGKLLVKDCICDAFLQQILTRPEEYDVIATMNLNGDYVSDALAACVGGIGIAPGANINYTTGHALFEATHGTAPKYAGLDKVNPCSLALSGEMLLRHLGWTEAAELINQGIEKAISDRVVTYDFARMMEMRWKSAAPTSRRPWSNGCEKLPFCSPGMRSCRARRKIFKTEVSNMKLVSILNEELVFTNVKGVSRSGIYTDMLRRAKDALQLPVDPDRLVSGMIEREDTLEIPYEGVALPHMRTEEIDDLYIIIGLLPKPVQLQSIDPEQCQLVIMSLISSETSDLYLKALSALIRFLGTGKNRQTLCSAANAREFLDILRLADVKIRSTLTAEDVLVRKVTALKTDDKLSTALDMFSRDDRDKLPVVNDQGKLVGELSATEVLHRFIPEYIFRLDNLDFVNSFEPFNRIFKEENEHIVGDYMRQPELVVKPDTPLIQFTVKMTKNNVSTCFVVDSDQKYFGEIMVKDIVKKVLRG